MGMSVEDDWFEAALLDLQITRLKYRAYSSEYQWQRFIRE